MSERGRKAGIAARTLAALAGGYALAALTAVACALGLPLLSIAPGEAVLTGTMLSFAVHAGAAVWAFAAGTAGRAWAGLLLPGLALGLVVGLCRALP